MANKEEIKISEKIFLTIDEAALLSNIGQNRIADLLRKPSCPFVLYVGRKKLVKLVKRRAFEQFLEANIELE